LPLRLRPWAIPAYGNKVLAGLESRYSGLLAAFVRKPAKPMEPSGEGAKIFAHHILLVEDIVNTPAKCVYRPRICADLATGGITLLSLFSRADFSL